MLGCAACGGGDDGAPVGGGFEDGVDLEDAKCPASTPQFITGSAAGLNQTSTTGITARIESASPQEPDRSTDNVWKISLTDASGQPATTATLTWACAWMDVHGHGSNPSAINSLGGGMFELADQNFSMYGPWQVRLWLDPTGALASYAPQSGTVVSGGHECMPTNGAGSSTPSVAFDFCVRDQRLEAQ